MEVVDTAFQEFVINVIVPFPVILERAGFERGYSYDRKVYCPFHSNTDTPAAKIYRSERGDTLFCYSSQHQYRPVDVIKKQVNCFGEPMTPLLKANIYSVFNKIWMQLTPEKQQSLADLYGKPVDVIPDSFKQCKDLDKFKSGELSYSEMMNLLIKVV